MDTEIELKLFVSSTLLPSIREKIANVKALDHWQGKLKSIYYDTPDFLLRQHDAGLRVRESEGAFVQTLKTTGRVVAGLHVRPEYNAPCQSIEPDVSLVPKEAWPAGIDIVHLGANLTPLFTTDFQRTHWLIETPDNTHIELAVDEGEVHSPQGGRTRICEIELELKAGQIDGLFAFSRELAKSGGLRLGNLSKAAQGYRLVIDHQGDEINALDVVKLTPQMSTEQAFIKILEHALAHWLYHEQIYVERYDPAAIVEICQSIGLIRQALTLYGGLIPPRISVLLRQELSWLDDELAWINEARAISRLCDDKGHFLRKLNAQKILRRKLDEHEQTLPAPTQVRQLLESARYCTLLLNLNQWILTRGWSPFLDDKAREKLNEPVLDFANRTLTHSWSELLNVLGLTHEMDRFTYIKEQPRLFRNLLTGVCLASLYDSSARETFRLPWLDILQGIEDFQLLEPVRKRLADEDISDEDKAQIEKWLQRKEISLLHAMAKSRLIGVTLPPYWQRM